MTSFKVVFKPRVAVRKQPSADAPMAGAKIFGDVLHGEVMPSTPNWLMLSEPPNKGSFVMIKHPQHGQLLESVEITPNVPDPEVVEATGGSLKKSFEIKQGRKACGANIKSVDANGSSRDALFDHLCIQELLVDFRLDFRTNKLPDELFNSDEVDDTECVTWFATNAQIKPLPPKKGKRKKPAGGVRQRVEYLGGLRCIIAETDSEVDQPPQLVVVLAHGIHVLGDDLFGLAHRVAKERVRFVLPQAPEESPGPLGNECYRKTRQWFAWSEGDSPEEVAARMKGATSLLVACVEASLEAAPNAKLVLGGFSQGALVALAVTLSCSRFKPAGLVQLCPPACHQDLDAADGLPLAGVSVMVAAGLHDETAPVAMGEDLLQKCEAAGGAAAMPILRFNGGHEVTPDVADVVGEFLEDFM
mmetsp:Transcript_74333/g.124053  ORF Transcript_74333/g.124053 Transcript_74333/m.124053 type:complete len:416 (-) Transcript_74333:251-1498(-)